jgi:hypothetical protein
MMDAGELFDPAEIRADPPPELTDAELFQDGERNPDGPRVLPFTTKVLNLRGKPCGK